MIGLETKDRDIILKDDGMGPGSFSGYFATWDGPDRANEIIAPGAFRNLDSFVKNGFITAGHDVKAPPIAMVDSAIQDSRGLLITGTYHDHPAAQAIRAVVRDRIKNKKSVPASIGYKVIASEPTKISGKSCLKLRTLDLYEGAFCNLPCNDKAGVFEAKRLTPELISVKELASWLESKEGRAISGDNLSRLVAHRNELQDGVDMLTAFIDVHNPESGKPNPFQSIDDSISPGRTGGGAAVARAGKSIMAWLEIQKKYGRALSAEHHNELSQAHRTLHYAVESLGGFLAEHRPGAVDDVGASLDKSSNPFLSSFVRLNDKQARLQELKAKVQAVSDRALLAQFEAEERAEAAASKAKSKR